MSRKVKPFSHAEYDRLKVRAQKFLDFAFRNKKQPSKKVLESLTIMLAGEYQRGYDAKNGRHFAPTSFKTIEVEKKLTRLQHLKKVIMR